MGEMPWRTLTLFQCRHKCGSHGHFGDRKDAGRHFGGLAGVSRGLAENALRSLENRMPHHQFHVALPNVEEAAGEVASQKCRLNE